MIQASPRQLFFALALGIKLRQFDQQSVSGMLDRPKETVDEAKVQPLQKNGTPSWT